MYVVGTSLVTLVDGMVHPDGTRHAVDVTGTSVCTGTRPAYAFPSIEWSASQDQPCAMCTSMTTESAYPAQLTADMSAAPAPAPALLAEAPALEPVGNDTFEYHSSGFFPV